MGSLAVPASTLQKSVFTLFAAALMAAALFSIKGCGIVENGRDANIPQTMLWAWERPENLSFIDTDTTGIAFLAQTVALQNEDVLRRPRMQPLEIPEGSFVMAVTRIETAKEPDKRPNLEDEQLRKTVDLIERTLDLPNVRAVQVDFDAVVSERVFYRKLLTALRDSIPERIPLSITSLASWCIGDRWFRDLPVDEVVPMAFEMGADEERIRKFLLDGNDWTERTCRKSYGLLADDRLVDAIDTSRRIYYFKRVPWTPEDKEAIKR
ncbi:MAG: hypothetical protein DWQ47_04095 [Acidobacteria bacterium]|nr:MAG: hypothetical protein DWQ32_07645 [Acidobacteriota bacterium]REK01577.1 MAG: hypothetical protein DWQ38_04080 [Acidobacteriota bacterium]REK14533.1 MAG: hypothetical protein DWQ43_13335 [Acidobacteriota bacterium]REK45248.1 MAG: hypothetical protein DWQ47_04095 [Acidobacteriota bacterium]